MAVTLFIEHSKPVKELLLSIIADNIAPSSALTTLSSIFIQEDENKSLMENARRIVVNENYTPFAWRFPGKNFWRT